MKPKRFRKYSGARRKPKNLTLDPILFDRVQTLCYGKGISVSELVNQKLADFVKENK